MSYILGRNCRFLQGPWTNPLSVRRLRDAVQAGKHHQECFLNYRRDGSPFMNLLMVAPLCDSRGAVRYFIGAQVDVSGLVKECAEMESLARLLDLQKRGEKIPNHQVPNPEKNDELRELSEMLNQNELSTIRRFGGRMHKDADTYYDDESESGTSREPRLLIKDPNTLTPPIDGTDPDVDPTLNAHLMGGITSGGSGQAGGGSGSSASSITGVSGMSGKLSGIYQHYLLVRPYPSLRILFASPSLRVPGILQSPFMNRIGGSNRVREELTAALAEGRGVTAKVRWVSGKIQSSNNNNASPSSGSGGAGAPGQEADQANNPAAGRNRWIHCTPLVGVNGHIGVWMIVIVDDEKEKMRRQFAGQLSSGFGRQPPAVSTPERNTGGASGGAGRYTPVSGSGPPVYGGHQAHASSSTARGKGNTTSTSRGRGNSIEQSRYVDPNGVRDGSIDSFRIT